MFFHLAWQCAPSHAGDMPDQPLPPLPPAPVQDLITTVLRQRFGLSGLRGQQPAVIARVMAGQDVLALLPTGAGKSLCYQLPCCLRPGLCVVVSPLLALMDDQCRRLQALGLRAMALRGRFGAAEQRSLDRSLQSAGLQVLLVSPERLLSAAFLERMIREVRAGRLHLLVVDEAHCISEWGNTFRPAYAKLGELRQHLPAVPVLALTASADPVVERQILAALQMDAHSVVRTSINRPELFYRVHRRVSPWRHALAYLQRWHTGDAVLFYCQRRLETEWLARHLVTVGIPARPYHAGMGIIERRAAEHWFLQAPAPVMVATIAFGMGIDRADIRLVVHAAPSSSLSAYYQETGRAGRDGQVATALQLLPPMHNPHWPDPDSPIMQYLHSGDCRRRSLMAGFGEPFAGACGHCDHCCPNWRPLPRWDGHDLAWVPQVGPVDGATGGTRTRMPDGARF